MTVSRVIGTANKVHSHARVSTVDITALMVPRIKPNVRSIQQVAMWDLMNTQTVIQSAICHVIQHLTIQHMLPRHKIMCMASAQQNMPNVHIM